jgi:hypothetical protein
VAGVHFGELLNTRCISPYFLAYQDLDADQPDTPISHNAEIIFYPLCFAESSYVFFVRLVDDILFVQAGIKV